MPAETTRDGITAAPAMGAPTIAPERRVLIFAAALASVFITQIESTIVATALPTIVGQIGGFGLLSWVFTIYLLTQAVTTPGLWDELASNIRQPMTYSQCADAYLRLVA